MRKIHFTGYSMGGMEALVFASRQQDMFAAVMPEQKQIGISNMVALDLIQYTTLCICETCRRYSCSFCAEIFTIEVDKRFRRGLQKRPLVMACGAARCQEKSVAGVRICVNKACAFKQNPHVLDEDGLTCFASYENRTVNRFCRRCMK